MQFPVLTDDDVRARTDYADAVAAMRDALAEHAAGTLHAPPRWALDGDGGKLVFTCGTAGDAGVMGFRVYDTVGEGEGHTQLVAVFDAASGRFRGLVAGYEVGVMRTGGLGGVAADVLARDSVDEVAVLGSGTHARSQLRALAAVRDPDVVRVFSPTVAHREAFADEVTEETGLDVVPVADAESAVRGADVVLAATTSESPVFEADWVAPGAHVTSLGPKFAGAHELPRTLFDRADAVVTDSLVQVRRYDDYADPFVVAPDAVGMTELSAVLAGDAPGRATPDDVTLYYSVGLAGTEVVLADCVLDV